ncbi:hypothetical protein D3C71_617230 [compost metagenome]
MNEQQPQAEATLDNVHPAEAGLEMPLDPNQVELDSKERMVLGFFRDVIDAEFTEAGIQFSDNTVDELANRFNKIKHGAVLAQRARLEKDPQFRHPIPYIPIHRHNEEGQLELFVYQRTKQVGEEKLFGKHSLAVGGHPEAPNMRFHPNWSIDGAGSMMACLVSELDEEVTFDGVKFSDFIQYNVTTYGHEGFIRDDSNEVGKQHLGVLFSIGVQPGVEVVTIEPELVTVGFMSLDRILSADSGLDLENWSYLLANAYAREIEAANAQAAADADVMDAALAEANAQIEVDAVAQLAPEPLTEERALAFLNTSGFNLLEWKLSADEALSVRGDNVFYDTIGEHPVDGRKELVICLDDNDPDPVATVAAIKAELVAQWGKQAELGCDDIGRGTDMETKYVPELDAQVTLPRGARPEFAHLDEVPFLAEAAPQDPIDSAMREARDVE